MLSLKVIFCILVDIRLLNWFNASSYRVLVVVDNCGVSFEGVVMRSNMTPKITAALLKVRIGYPYSLRNNRVFKWTSDCGPSRPVRVSPYPGDWHWYYQHVTVPTYRWLWSSTKIEACKLLLKTCWNALFRAPKINIFTRVCRQSPAILTPMCS